MDGMPWLDWPDLSTHSFAQGCDMSRLVSGGAIATLRIVLQHIANEATLLESLHSEAAHRDGLAELWRLADLGEPPKIAQTP